MGDDELNFTEQEAQLWAGDARNEPERRKLTELVAVIGFLCLIVLVLIIAAAMSPRLKDQPKVVRSAPTSSLTVP